MKTRAQRFLESRSFLVLTGLVYLALAGVLFYVIGTRSKPDIGIILSKLVPKVLWANFLLIAFGIVLCRRDIAGTFHDLFSTGEMGPHAHFPATAPGDAGATDDASRDDVIAEASAAAGKHAETRHTGPDPASSPVLDSRFRGNDGIGIYSCRVNNDGKAPLLAPLKNRIAAALSMPGVRLLLIVLAGALLVTLVAPQTHRIYYDEDIYANMGQNIAYTGQAGMANYGTFEYGEYFVNWLLYNKDPAGWPYLMSLVFQLFGTDETLAFYLNNLLFAGGILVVFFIARMLAGGQPFPALLAALVYALIPHNLIWSNTIAAENAAAVFGGLAVLCALAWLRTREPRRLFLLAVVLPFACAMRPESSLIALWVFSAAAINLFAKGARLASAYPDQAPCPGADFRHPLATRVFWAMGTIAFALILPIIWHFHAMSGESWGAEGAKFATSFFIGNVTVNGFYFLNNREFPLLFTLLALMGLAVWMKWQEPEGLGRPNVSRGQEGPREQGEQHRVEKPRETEQLRGHVGLQKSHGLRADFRCILLMLLWFLLFWGIFLFFYAGSYKYGADVRFALVCFMPLAILAGLGGGVLRGWLDRLLQAVMSRPGQQAPGEQEEEAPALQRTRFRGETRLPVAGLLLLLLLISWLKFIPLIRTVGQEAWGARYDHMHAREFIGKIPNRSVVLTHIPTMFLLWGQTAIQTFAGINNPDLIRDLMHRYNGHLYFHKSYWCNAVNDSNRSICDGIVQKYDLEPVVVAREQSHEYGLYRMTFKK